MIVVYDKSYDNTNKLGIKLNDGSVIETVIIKQKNTISVCLSTQVGCPLGCKFCASGKTYKRDLTATEIEKQFNFARDKIVKERNSDKKISIVFMGIGEPLLNLDNVMLFVKKICYLEKNRFPKSRITISTIGIPHLIRKLSEVSRNIVGNDNSTLNLAISLHFVEDNKRKSFMPNACGISELFDSCVEYQANSLKSQKIMIEYIMLSGINDSLEDAQKLVDLIQLYDLRAIVNLIPYNGNEFVASNDEKIKDFKSIIIKNNIKCFVRENHSTDINSACGMLMSK